jgi:hypothetical protein
MGCKQSAYVNYQLVYEDGYFESLHECVFCDYIEGPLLVSTKKIQEMQFSKELVQGVFEDFFLRLYNQNSETVVCPDSMFFANKPKLPTTTELLPFMNKWNIYQFSERHSWNHTYPCDKYATCSRIASVMQHPCCTQLSIKSLKHVMGRCEALNIICKLLCGDFLSGVKISGKFPWDMDSDVNFVSANFSVMKQILTDSKKQGYGFL